MLNTLQIFSAPTMGIVILTGKISIRKWVKSDLLLLRKRQNKLKKTSKASGFDLITGKVKLIYLINASFRLKYVPKIWNVAEVAKILKPLKTTK